MCLWLIFASSDNWMALVLTSSVVCVISLVIGCVISSYVHFLPSEFITINRAQELRYMVSLSGFWNLYL